MTSLLATIVAARQLQPEPVATDALVHLFNASAAATQAITDLLQELCPGAGVDSLRFTGQDLDPELPGRPDVVAADTQGTRLVIEAKFDAELTSAQLSTAYLDRLTPGVPGALVFLVPADRLESVWRKVVAGPGGQSTPVTFLPEHGNTGLAYLPLKAQRTLAVISWESLIKRISAAMAKQGDQEGAAELAQIEGLFEWRSRAGWTPLLPEDLPQRTGRQLQALSETVIRALQ